MKKEKKYLPYLKKTKQNGYVYNVNINLWQTNAFLIIHGEAALFYVVEIQVRIVVTDSF